MEKAENKKLAMIRIWQILKEHSDIEHPLTQNEIAKHLEHDYGIIIERKAISRNISLLKEAGCEIESERTGCYLAYRGFEDSEIRLLIDGVLCSRHIAAKHSSDLIERLCKLSNKYFRSHIKNVCTVNDWNKTENHELFINIELIDEAIEQNFCIEYDYNKYSTDKKLHKTSRQLVTPYQLILHNQHYYLMAHSERWEDITFHRLERITNMIITDKKATPLRSVKGYENGISYKQISSAMPYMYTDTPENIDIVTERYMVDQVIDWFGKDIRISEYNEEKVKISLKVSPNAMEHWVMQYAGFVEVIAPPSFRERVKKRLEKALKSYLPE